MSEEEYNKKVDSLQKFIPFLENMITQLKDPSKKNREQQLNKMESLHAMITDRKKKLKIETLNKCEDVITKLYMKVNTKPMETENEGTSSPIPSSSVTSKGSTPSERTRREKVDTSNKTVERWGAPKADVQKKRHSGGKSDVDNGSKTVERLGASKSDEQKKRHSGGKSDVDNDSKTVERLGASKSDEQKKRHSGGKADVSKPPISLDDLKCLEVDVQEKINETASLKELTDKRNKIATELMFENIKSMNKEKPDSDKDFVRTELNSKLDQDAKDFERQLTQPKPKVLKEPSSGFGSILSNIDDKIREINRKREERRNSYFKDEKAKKPPFKEGDDNKDIKRFDENKVINPFKSDTRTFDDPRRARQSNSDNQSFKNKFLDSNLNLSAPKTDVDTASLKKLADKYNAKPRISPFVGDVDKNVHESIEQNMKISPQIPPLMGRLTDPPPPPPASLVKCSQLEPELPHFKPPVTTQAHSIHSRGIHPTPRVIPQIPSLLSPMENFAPHPNPPSLMSLPINPSVHASPRDNFSSPSSVPMSPRDSFLSPRDNVLMSPRDNFVSEYAREDYNSRRPQFEPSIPHMPSNNRMIAPNITQRYNQNFNFNHMESPQMDFHPQNICPPSPQYTHHIPPLIPVDVPHYPDQNQFQNMGQFGPINREPYLPKDDLRWRLEDNRQWERRDFKPRFGGPMTYREHREMRENSRDPRVVRDTKERDSRDNKEIRDPRLNRDKLSRDREGDNTAAKPNSDLPEKNSRDPRLNRGRSSSREDTTRSNRYESKFDRMYSRTNKNRSRSRSRSQTRTETKEDDTFSSPLDSLYNTKEDHKTGKGYGVQSFRIPKKRKGGNKLKEQDIESSKGNTSQDDEPDDSKMTDVGNVEEDSNESVECLNKTESVQEPTVNDTSEKTEVSTKLDKIETDNTTSGIEADSLEVTSTTLEVTSQVDKEEESQASTISQSEEHCKTDVSPESKTESNDKLVENQPQTSTKIEEPVKPATEQTILAQFFANLLGSQNKKEKKTALYSLISTFSDSFSPKELTKITKIIHADKEDKDSSDEEKPEKAEETSKTVESSTSKEVITDDSTKSEQSTVDETVPSKRDLRRRKSSTSPVKQTGSSTETDSSLSETKKSTSSEEILEKEDDPMDLESEVLVTVGERIKSRKRTVTLADKPKKKIRSELDRLHEDIQEMFIRDGVLTASGKRMCHLLKDDNTFTLNPESPKSNTEETVKVRKKPGPKPKSKKQNDSDVKAMKSVRILIQKIPDATVEESSAYARRLTRSMTVTESDDESSISTEISVSNKGTDFEDEGSNSEKEDYLPTSDNQKSKSVKRKRPKSSWAAGIIKKKKIKRQNSDKLPETEVSPKEACLSPSKEYWVDFSLQKKQYACKLCDFQGRYITTHYKVEHPSSEVLTSRFSPALAEESIADAKINMDKYEKYQQTRSTKITFACRFCTFHTSVVPTLFYDHISTHTGEYRHTCPNCTAAFCSGKTLKVHMTNSHKGTEKPVVRKAYNEIIIFGYLCDVCNYVQMKKQNVEEHVKNYHSGKATIHKINLSTVFEKEIENLYNSEKLSESVEENSNTNLAAIDDAKPVDSSISTSESSNAPENVPLVKKPRSKPCPKSKKKVDVTQSTSDDPVPNTESTEAHKPPSVRRSIDDIDPDQILPMRSKRAAKEKAQEKLKEIMEMTDVPLKKKNSENTTADIAKPSPTETPDKPTEPIETNDDKNIDQNVSESKEKPTNAQPEQLLPDVKIKTEIVKKEIDMNVFTCKTDIQEENKKIEQERLQKMEELNVSLGSRTSLNFVDKLCHRLNQSEVEVKKEPVDDFIDTVHNTLNEAPATMPVLERIIPTASYLPKIDLSPIKKPIIETDTPLSKLPFDVSQKNDKSIVDMIEKLKGKLKADKNFKNNSFVKEDNDNEGPPPLIHVNELTYIRPFSASTKILEVCGLIKVIKTDTTSTFCCLVPPCVFSTEDKDAFLKHCKESHLGITFNKSALCETCGVQIHTLPDTSLLENLFRHTITDHSDFIVSKRGATDTSDFTVPKPPQMIRLRKLSGDALSLNKNQDTQQQNTEESEVGKVEKDYVGDLETSTTNEKDEKTNESEDNPFPFKIADVVSLAETPQNPPPLTPINKQQQLVVKEAKLTSSELANPRKSQKAIAKFIEDVENLYKCPHYYCLFSTESGEKLQQHLRTHIRPGEDNMSMIPCVYCDLKTPWAHVVIHIDIRHANCRYACPYCLYRACLKSYVTLHQERVHPYQPHTVTTLHTIKYQKKFAISDAKLDPKTLCKPYRCTPGCSLEFLFENEFYEHVMSFHKNNSFLTCGHESCTSRITPSKISHHWSMSHNVSVYQCGYCAGNSNEIGTMYHHLSNMHPNLNPEILVRIISPRLSYDMFYTPDAFKKIRKIVNVTNIPESSTISQSPSKPTLIVPSPQNSPKTDASTVPTKENTSALLLTPSTSNTASYHLSSLKDPLDIGTFLDVSIEAITNDQQLPTISIQESSIPTKEDTLTPSVPDISLEQVSFSEDTQQDESAEGDVDPLELGDSMNSQTVGYSSEDDNDKDKPKKKYGLLGYQLFRCAICEFSGSNLNDFKKHVAKSKECRAKDNLNKPFACVHCKKSFKSGNILCEHIQCHGILRYSCSICGNKFPTSGQARGHMKYRHNVNQTTQTSLNSTSSSGGEEYIIKPKPLIADQPAKENIITEPSSPVSAAENVYNPGDTNKIPMRSIFSSDLRCGVCTYATKVRTNMVRHLQFHTQEISVPDTAPVNPVPCLEKNEKMFDKMINLASSSHKSGGRMGGGNKKDDVNFPEFVRSGSRYTCCAQGCNYICPEEANLRHHLIALHSEEPNIVCVHCKLKLTATDADGIIKHIKLHGLQLYKCQYCDFIHNLKHKVERHSSDTHSDLPNKVVTLRCLESEPKDDEVDLNQLQLTPTSNQSKILKPWRCCMCKTKSATQEGIQSHVLEKHNIDSQYKCALCIYKTNDESTFSDHFKEVHSDQEINVIHVYLKIEEEQKDEKDPDAFDTTPLWQRDRPRVRHIRGILFDESSPVPTKSPKKATKSSSSTVTPPKKVLDLAVPSESIPSIKCDSEELIDQVNQLMKSDVDDDVIIIDDEDDSPVKPKVVKTYRRKTIDSLENKNMNANEYIDIGNFKIEDEFSELSLLGSFGQFGLPFMKQLKCPKCNKFKSKRISDFIFHMYKEKEINRYACGLCSDVSVTYKYMYKHVLDHQKPFDVNNIINLPRNPRLEIWLQRLIRMQCNTIVRSLQAPKEIPPNSSQHKVLCRYCNKWYRSEQERNEHAIFHWKCIPYKCSECSFESYTRSHMAQHIASPHGKGNAAFIIESGPTVAGELQYSDFLHMKETEEERNKSRPQLVSPKPANETTIAEVLVPEVVIHDMIDESEQDGTVQGMSLIDETIDKVVEVTDSEPEASSSVDVTDLVIVTKTDTNVPHSGDVFCCEYCPYMSNSETLMMSHISGQHEHMHIKFKVLNRHVCDKKLDEYVACSICNEVGSEITIRQHHLEVHEGETFFIYRFLCCWCQKRFAKFHGVRTHFNRTHPGVQLQCKDIFNNIHFSEPIKVKSVEPVTRRSVTQHVQTGPKSLLKHYKCTECTYARDFTSNSLGNIRAHVRNHFKAYICGYCGVKVKSKSEGSIHFKKEHFDLQENIVHDENIDVLYSKAMSTIMQTAVPVQESSPRPSPSQTPTKQTARKSTSSKQLAAPIEEYSFYGNIAENVDLSKIMSSVEINGMHLSMSADKLGTLFDLNPSLCLEKCDEGNDVEDDIISVDS